MVLMIKKSETRDEQVKKRRLQQNFSGSKTDGSFTTAASNSFWGPLEKSPMAADLE